jgi:hypothetical protein
MMASSANDIMRNWHAGRRHSVLTFWRSRTAMSRSSASSVGRPRKLCWAAISSMGSLPVLAVPSLDRLQVLETAELLAVLLDRGDRLRHVLLAGLLGNRLRQARANLVADLLQWLHLRLRLLRFWLFRVRGPSAFRLCIGGLDIIGLRIRWLVFGRLGIRRLVSRRVLPLATSVWLLRGLLFGGLISSRLLFRRLIFLLLRTSRLVALFLFRVTGRLTILLLAVHLFVRRRDRQLHTCAVPGRRPSRIPT